MAGSFAIGGRPRIAAVVFDVGETLIDETALWTAWADRLGIPRLTFLAALGAAIARGEHHHAPIRLLRPDVDPISPSGPNGPIDPPRFGPDDLYPDALPALRALAAADLRLGVAGNQPAWADAMFEGLDVRLDLVASSASLGVAKPDPAFFRAVAERLALPTSAIAYVGDRVDNDVQPAAAAGMTAVFVRRGPWAWIGAGRDDPPEADLVVDALADLPAALARLGG